MNITRHNYEEYFILYMDNELDSEGRRMVEAFAQQHPDLKEELDNLLQYKLTPDTSIFFDGKEDLLKENGHSLITLNNYQEWLSLYIDNELDSEQVQLIDRFVAMHPAAQRELALLQQTKLQPDNIVFANKDSLYRKEEKVRRIPVWGWRAAAAVLILAIAIPAAVVLNKKPSAGRKDEGVAKINTDNTGKTLADRNNIQPGTTKNDNSVAAEEKNSQTTVPFVADTKNRDNAPVQKNRDNNIAVLKKQGVSENKQPEVIAPVKKDEQAVAQNFPEQKPTNNLPKPLNNPNIIDNNAGNALADNNTADKKNNDALPETIVTKPAASPSDYTNVVYNPGNTGELEQPDGNKNKNRGLFRKIARTFQKRTNIDPTDDDRLLVGGLAIKLK